MKRLGQDINETQSWICLLARVKSDALNKQYCIGTWNVRSMKQGKLDTVKQKMAKLSINILGTNELKWTGMGKFNSDGHYIYYCG